MDCVVVANALKLNATHFANSQQYRAVHAIVTPDAVGCARLSRSIGSHFRCVDESAVVFGGDQDGGDNNTVAYSTHTRHSQDSAHMVGGSAFARRKVAELVERVGPHARAKGVAWFWQQALKLQAVASGLGGLLGSRVRVMDGDVLVLRRGGARNWFTASGGEIFDFTGQPQPRRPSLETNVMKSAFNSSSSGNEISANGDDADDTTRFNGWRYGALWFAATGRRLYGSHHAVTHGMSMTRVRTQGLLATLASRKAREGGNGADGVAAALELLCDDAAVTGFSEYWYYFSFAIEETLMHQQRSAQLIQQQGHYHSEARARFPPSEGPLCARLVAPTRRAKKGRKRRGVERSETSALKGGEAERMEDGDGGRCRWLARVIAFSQEDSAEVAGNPMSGDATAFKLSPMDADLRAYLRHLDVVVLESHASRRNSRAPAGYASSHLQSP